MKNKKNVKTDCCGDSVKPKESKGFWSGLLYGLLPHTGCIAFIIFTILGVTTATAFFKPLLLNRYFFYILIALSFVFATISAVIYLKKRGFLSLDGIRMKWKYLSVLYGAAIGINLLLFMVIFPIATNMTSASPTGAVIGIDDDTSSLKLKVDIPCPGHAPLISEELKTIDGVLGIQFSFPNVFYVTYDSTKTSKQEMLSLEVFDSYKPTVLDETVSEEEIQQVSNQPVRTGCGCGGSTCGGTGSCCGV